MNVNWNSDFRSKGLSGLISGIDTDSMVEKLLQGTQKKIDTQNSAKQQLQWKQTQYQSVIKDINSFKDKYFNSSYDADISGNLLSPKFFNSMDSAVISGDAVRVVSSDSSSQVGEMRVSVSQLASAAKLSAGIKMSGAQTITGGTMDTEAIRDALNSGEELSFDLTLDGVTKSITFSSSDFSEGIDEGSIKEALDSKLSRAFGDYVKAEADTTDNKLAFSINIGVNGGVPEAGHELKITGADAAKFGIEPGSSSLFQLSTKLGSLAGAPEGGSYKFSINGESFELGAEDSVNTLLSKINNSPAGVRISYSPLTDSFSMEAGSTGANYGIQIEAEEGNILGELFGEAPTFVSGKDAKLTINGVETSRSSNTFTFEGITLTASKTSAEETVIGTVRDSDRIVDTVKSFVEDYNKIVEKLYGYISEDAEYKNYAPLTAAQKKEMSEDEIKDWTEKAKTGLLRSDPTISSFLNSMRSAFYTKVESAGIAAYSIGIETTEGSRAGSLSLDETALRNAIASDPAAVEKLFTDSEEGLAVKLNETSERYARLSMANPGSLVRMAGAEGFTAYSKQNDMYLQLDRINDRLSDLQTKYEKEREKYWDKFNAMESIIAQYSAQSSMISSSFSDNSY